MSTVVATSQDVMSGRRAAYKGMLSMAGHEIPIAIYGAQEEFSLDTHYYHGDGCGTRIVQPLRCPDHPDLATDADDEAMKLKVFSGMDFGDVIVEVDNEDRNTLLHRKAPLEFHTSMRLVELPGLMSQSKFAFMGMYRVQHPENYHDLAVSPLATLLERMRVKKQFIVCTVALSGGMKRWFIILPTGVAYRLAYKEEIRSFPVPGGVIDKDLGKDIDAVLAVPHDLPVMTHAHMTDRLTGWFTDCVKTLRSLKG